MIKIGSGGQIAIFAKIALCSRNIFSIAPMGKSNPVSKLGFLKPATIDIWGLIIPSCGVCLVHGRIFSSTPGLYPLD